MKHPIAHFGFALALAAAGSATAAVPGFAGNITGGGSATPVVVSTLAQAQTAVNNYNGTSGLVLHYNGTFDEQAILNNICGQWSKPATELSISGKNNITILGFVNNHKLARVRFTVNSESHTIPLKESRPGWRRQVHQAPIKRAQCSGLIIL